MAGRNLRMSDAETLKFLEYYKKEPALWDPTNDGYGNKELCAAASKRIAEALKLADFTASHVITEFKNLRSSYAEELQKIAASTKKKLTSIEHIYVPRVVWFEAMHDFLSSVKSRATHSNLSRTSGVDDETEDPQSETQFEEVDVVRDSSPQPEPSTEQPRSSTQQGQRAVSEDKSKSNPSKTPLKKPSERTVPEKGYVPAKNDNSFDEFGKYLASQLRTLPYKKALMLKKELFYHVLEASMASLPPYIGSDSE